MMEGSDKNVRYSRETRDIKIIQILTDIINLNQGSISCSFVQEFCL